MSVLVWGIQLVLCRVWTLAFHVRGRTQAETFKSRELRKTFGLNGVGEKLNWMWLRHYEVRDLHFLSNGVEVITLRRVFFTEAIPLCSNNIIQCYWKWLSGSYTIHSICKPMWFISVGLRQWIRFTFLLFPEVSRNCMYESEPPLKPSPLTCYIELDYRVDVCRITNGAHIEHL